MPSHNHTKREATSLQTKHPEHDRNHLETIVLCCIQSFQVMSRSPERSLHVLLILCFPVPRSVLMRPGSVKGLIDQPRPTRAPHLNVPCGCYWVCIKAIAMTREIQMEERKKKHRMAKKEDGVLVETHRCSITGVQTSAQQRKLEFPPHGCLPPSAIQDAVPDLRC